jgi:hypothetical protein
MKKTILAILGLAMFFTVSLFAQQTPVTKANYELAERFSPKKLNRMVFSQSVRTNWFPSGDKFWYECGYENPCPEKAVASFRYVPAPGKENIQVFLQSVTF